MFTTIETFNIQINNHAKTTNANTENTNPPEINTGSNNSLNKFYRITTVLFVRMT